MTRVAGYEKTVMQTRFWRIDNRPKGTRFAEALTLAETTLPHLGEGEIRLRNILLSMDAGTRLWLTDREDGYQPPLPDDSPMSGLVLGEVIQSRSEAFKEGDLVRAFGTWADFSQVDPITAGAIRLDPSVTDKRAWFGPLGMNGWTALWGVQVTGAAQPGERVLVSAAAGATGLLAVQIAKRLGCQAWGVAGSEEKRRFLVEKCGVAGALDYKAEDFDDQLEAAGGFDVYFDNVGGPILDKVLRCMNHYGRIAVCGLVSDYTSGERTTPREFDQVLMRRLRVEGFFSPDFMDQGERLTQQLRGWFEDGDLIMPYDVTHGLENALLAYEKLFTGGNLGKAMVELGE
ncbi:MAG: NADP-dependent oxidoreductase [Pseudomonadota bacterium]